MRRSYHKKRPKKKAPVFRMNEQITVPTVVVVDAEGENRGEMNTKQAIQLAEDSGLDLVEVNPKGQPPTCKILDYGNFKYKKEKALNKQKAKKVDNKSIRLTPRISQHDLEVRYSQAKKFLSKGSRLTLELQLRGREHQHTELTKEMMNDFITRLQNDPDMGDLKVEQPVKKQGSKITSVISSKEK